MDLPFDTTGLEYEQIERFNETYRALRSRFHIGLTGHIDFYLNNFEVFRRYQDVNLRNSYVLKNGRSDGYVLFVETCTKSIGKNENVHCHEYQAWALAYLKKDFGRVMIRPETLADKLLELIHPIELDFEEDKAFSDTFYVLVNDRPKAISAIDRNFRNVVMDIRHDDFVIEIVDHTLIIGNHKPILPENAVKLAEFVTRLCSNC